MPIIAAYHPEYMTLSWVAGAIGSGSRRRFPHAFSIAQYRQMRWSIILSMRFR